MFEAFKSWLKLRRDRSAQQKRLDKQLQDFMARHQRNIDRYQYSPVTGRRLYWKVESNGEPPFDSRTGLANELAFEVSVQEHHSNRSFSYMYDVTKAKLLYRTSNCSYGYGWTTMPDEG